MDNEIQNEQAASPSVPVIDKDGNAGMVTNDQAQAGVQAGDLQIGFHVTLNGTHAVVPAGKLHDFLKEPGAKIYQHPQDQTQFEKDRTPEGSALGRGVKAAGKELVNVPLGIASAVGSAIDPMAAGVKAGAQIASDDAERKAEGRSGAYRVAAAGAGLLGVNARGMEEAAERGDTAGVAGTAVGDAGIAAAMPKLMEKAKAWSAERIANRAITPKQAATKLTDAVNPPAQEMGKFTEDMHRQLPRIVDYAEKNGIALQSEGRQGLLKAARGAGEEHQQLYDEQLLEPIRDKKFRDPATGALSDTTYGEMEARLRHLNRTTNYNATTAAESEAQLVRKAEAIGLRDKLNRSMANELGLEPDQIQDARQAGEQLRDLADKTEMAIDVERHSRNTAKRGNIGGVHATPHGAGSTGGGRFGTHVTEAWEKVAGHPADKAVHEVFRNLEAEKPKLATPNVPKPTPPENNLTPQQKSAIAGAAANKKAAPGSTATIGEQAEAKAAAAAADDGLSAWPKEYKGGARTATRNSRGGANYSAVDLKAFKKKHNL